MRSLFCLLAFASLAAAGEPIRVHRNHIAALTAQVDGTDVQVTASPGLTVWRSMTTDPKTVDVRAKASLPGCYSVVVSTTLNGKISSQTFCVRVVAWPYRLLVTNAERSP